MHQLQWNTASGGGECLLSLDIEWVQGEVFQLLICTQLSFCLFGFFLKQNTPPQVFEKNLLDQIVASRKVRKGHLFS